MRRPEQDILTVFSKIGLGTPFFNPSFETGSYNQVTS